MSNDPLTLATVPADEKWDETLDALALVAVREMAERGLLEEGAEAAARYHVRGFGRRLLNPLLDQVRFEVQSGHREAAELRRESALMRGRVVSMQRTRRSHFRLGILLGMLWALLIVWLGSLVLAVWSHDPPGVYMPPRQDALVAPALGGAGGLLRTVPTAEHLRAHSRP